MSDKIRCYSIGVQEGANPLIVATPEEVLTFLCENEELEGMDDDAQISITIVYLTQEELDALPEWDGP